MTSVGIFSLFSGMTGWVHRHAGVGPTATPATAGVQSL